MKTSRIGRSVSAALIILTLANPALRAKEPAPTTQPKPVGKIDEDAREMLKAVLDRKALRLSNDGESVADRFEFLLTLIVPGKGGGGAGASSYIVARDKDSIAALVLSARGDPFAYATQGLMAGFDLTDPGRLILYEPARRSSSSRWGKRGTTSTSSSRF